MKPKSGTSERIHLGEHADTLLRIILTKYIWEGDASGLPIARLLQSASGEPAPIDEMICWILCDQGRLLKAHVPPNADSGGIPEEIGFERGAVACETPIVHDQVRALLGFAFAANSGGIPEEIGFERGAVACDEYLETVLRDLCDQGRLLKAHVPPNKDGAVDSVVVLPVARGTGEPIPVIEVVDCGEFHPWGICPACGRGHGMVIQRREDNVNLTVEDQESKQ